MLGLFGTLNLGTRALQTQQTGVEVTGQNLANVNNPAYARQRVQIQTSLTLQSELGPQGTGAYAKSIEQLRDLLLDEQIRNEQSVGGYWTAQQNALQNAQISLNEFLNRTAGTSATDSTNPQGLSDALSGFFNAFQAVATAPTSLTARQQLVNAGQTLATRLNETSSRMTELKDSLNEAVKTDVNSANQLLADIANLNDQIAKTELPLGGTANDLRDLREQKLEELAKLTNFQTTTAQDGSLTINIGGYDFVSGNQVVDTLGTFGRTGQVYGDNEILVLSMNHQTVLNLTGGSMAGTMGARDGSLASLRTQLDTLTNTIISQVNTLHQSGFSLTGSTGADFFGGTDAATINVSSSLIANPSLVQAAGTNNPGDNSVALALAQLAGQPIAGLQNQTIEQFYASIVGDFGNALSGANTQVANHEAVNTALLKQRDSVSGVSIDEEMTNLITYQKAYQASAKIVTTVDEMLDTILGMKR